VPSDDRSRDLWLVCCNQEQDRGMRAEKCLNCASGAERKNGETGARQRKRTLGVIVADFHKVSVVVAHE